MSGKSNPLSALRSLLIFVPLIYLYTAVLGTLSLLSSLFDRNGRIQHGFARLWSRMILGTVGSRVTVVGLENVDLTLPHVYVVNHLSAMDIPVLYAHLPVQFRIMAKKELFRYPFLGWHLKLSGQIPIERENARASLKSMNRAAEAIRAGMPLLVFPEGGRCRDGRVQTFMPGAFYTAIRAQTEVVPMALVGTFEMLPMNSFHVRPRRLELVVGKPMPTEGMHMRDMDKLAARAQEAVEELYYARSVAGRGSPAKTTECENNADPSTPAANNAAVARDDKE